MAEIYYRPLDRYLDPALGRKVGSAAVSKAQERATVATVEVRYTGDPTRVDRFMMPIVTDDGKK